VLPQQYIVPHRATHQPGDLAHIPDAPHTHTTKLQLLLLAWLLLLLAWLLLLLLLQAAVCRQHCVASHHVQLTQYG
jgi:hypothetical protein